MRLLPFAKTPLLIAWTALPNTVRLTIADPCLVIPAKAGIHVALDPLRKVKIDPSFRWDDDVAFVV
jgi:hypothetical protein